MEKRGCDMTKLRAVILMLASGANSPPALKDHALKGNWEGCRDLHIETDWILIYEIKDNTLGLCPHRHTRRFVRQINRLASMPLTSKIGTAGKLFTEVLSQTL